MTPVLPSQYVPLLRWKRGEQAALRLLGAERPHVVPLIEPFKSSWDIDSCQSFAEEILRSWGQLPFFLDVIAQGGRANGSVGNIMKSAMSNSIAPVLVARLANGAESQSLLKEIGVRSDQGVCLRITREDLRSATLEPRLEVTLDVLGRRPQDIDLIIDFGIAKASDPSFSYLEERLPRFDAWRSVVVLGGSFPPNLSGLSVGEHELTRQEWTNWIKQIAAISSRIPTFGDSTTQYPIYSEPPPGANVSASIRYTSDDYWLVMRGEGLRNKTGAGFAQYPAQAQLLMERKEYCGPLFSKGDAYIEQIALQELKTTGNPETWLRAGINHHIVFVVRQIATALADLAR